MRLIDADALIGNVFDEREKRGIGVLVATALIRHASVCPTIDAVEVVHGRWVDNGIPESMLSKCTVCGFPCGACTFNFCPDCGAKMDGERRADHGNNL